MSATISLKGHLSAFSVSAAPDRHKLCRSESLPALTLPPPRNHDRDIVVRLPKTVVSCTEQNRRNCPDPRRAVVRFPAPEGTIPMKRAPLRIRQACVCLLMPVAACAASRAQDTGAYSNRKVFSGFIEYSNDSSHMLLGYAEGRKITALGASFERRRFLGENLSGSWSPQVRPFMTVTDPTMTGFALKFPQQPSYSATVLFASPVPVDTPVKS